MSPRFRTTAAVRRSAAAFDACSHEKRFRKFWEGRIEVGKTPRCSLPPVPPGRAEAVFEGPALLHGEVRDRQAQFRPGTARPVAAPEGRGLPAAIARETEGQAQLQAARDAVTQLPGGA